MPNTANPEYDLRLGELAITARMLDSGIECRGRTADVFAAKDSLLEVFRRVPFGWFITNWVENTLNDAERVGQVRKSMLGYVNVSIDQNWVVVWVKATRKDFEQHLLPYRRI